MSLLQEWLSSHIIAERDKNLINHLSEDDRKEQFHQHVDFGTGGIRNKMGLGPNRLNIYTIARICFGVGKTLLAQDLKPTVVIAYDTRNHSEEFGRVSANILSAMGVQVYLFPQPVPTPLLSFATRFLKAQLGIMITASHNPPIYNGYKLYDANGCQLVPHQALAFQRTIAQLPNLVPLSQGNQDLIKPVGPMVETAYLKMVLESAKGHVKLPLNVAYSSLHGTGYPLAKAVIEGLEYTMIPVVKECIPDGNFTAVKSSNPEDMSAYIGMKQQFNQQKKFSKKILIKNKQHKKNNLTKNLTKKNKTIT
jgi:phosphoglucomutase